MKWLMDLIKMILAYFQKEPDPIPIPDPIPDPLPPLPPSPVEPGPIPLPPPANPLPLTEIVVADLNTIPERMRQVGFQGSDNALYYALAYVAAYGPGNMPDDGAGSLVELSRRSPEIEIWWWDEVDKVIDRMRYNSNLTAKIIEHDGRDRCGFRLGPPTLQRFQEFGDRVQPGHWVSPEDY